MEEIEHILRNFGLLLDAGLVSQLIATVVKLPQMVVLGAAGALIGPSVLGLVSNPLSGVGAQLLLEIMRTRVQRKTSKDARASTESAFATKDRGSVRQKSVMLSCPLTCETMMRNTSAKVVTLMPPPVEVGAVPTNMSKVCTTRVGSRI